ncbi:hypothetical protein BOTBODRAFT_59116 [Botryobasidium botryosum FD-172 SS1]|uniref:Methyltransferase n=1 Tax=Botryobasidium botryosum (strain FD-172 SS1) TaxID=930990 RepID=A0A067M220_BOTB1|nr:hypothetical protein BOTBODRAFT_59116 [Botryobasidium botryosum FD-172 SS1]
MGLRSRVPRIEFRISIANPSTGMPPLAPPRRSPSLISLELSGSPSNQKLAMTHSAPLALGDVRSKLTFFLPPPNGEPAYQYFREVPPGKLRRNSVDDPRDVVIHNARGLEDTLTLEVNGFEFVKHTSAETEFLDEDAITTRYYAEMEALLRDHTGAKRVHVYNHIIRRNYEGKGPEVARPADRVHVDQTFEEGPATLRRILPDEAEELLKGRVRIVNVWRPIGAPVHHNPLTVADYRTLSLDDLIPVRLMRAEAEVNFFNIRYNENLKWYYLKEQTPSEVVLIKCFDSAVDHERARLCPHGSFNDTTSPPDAPKRQSIEVRAFLFD